MGVVVMSYKDRTWCSFKYCTKWNSCDRAFTDDERKKAIEWWGDEGYPLSMFATKPECYKGDECK